jgi:hypothetical protein
MLQAEVRAEEHKFLDGSARVYCRNSVAPGHASNDGHHGECRPSEHRVSGTSSGSCPTDNTVTPTSTFSAVGGL